MKRNYIGVDSSILRSPGAISPVKACAKRRDQGMTRNRAAAIYSASTALEVWGASHFGELSASLLIYSVGGKSGNAQAIVKAENLRSCLQAVLFGDYMMAYSSAWIITEQLGRLADCGTLGWFHRLGGSSSGDLNSLHCLKP